MTVEEEAQLPPFLKVHEAKLTAALENLRVARAANIKADEHLTDAVRLLREEIARSDAVVLLQENKG